MIIVLIFSVSSSVNGLEPSTNKVTKNFSSVDSLIYLIVSSKASTILPTPSPVGAYGSILSNGNFVEIVVSSGIWSSTLLVVSVGL